MTSLSLPRPRTLTLDVATTLTGVAVLIVLGKLTAALGAALNLPNACWQLLALRAASAALVVGGLTLLNRDRLWLFGIAYAAALSLTHFSIPIFLGATLAGLAASTLRHFRFGPILPTLTFVLVLAFPGLIKKLTATPPLPLTALATDLGIRLAAASLVLVAISKLASRRESTVVAR